MKVSEYITAYGHKRILATHSSTFEVTKDKELSYRGDCIIAVHANKGLRDFSSEFKALAKRSDALIRFRLEVDGLNSEVLGKGHEKLTFLHPTDIVVRKSRYVCDRTLMVSANKAAIDIPREIIKLLRNPKQKIEIEVTVET